MEITHAHVQAIEWAKEGILLLGLTTVSRGILWRPGAKLKSTPTDDGIRMAQIEVLLSPEIESRPLNELFRRQRVNSSSDRIRSGFI